MSRLQAHRRVRVGTAQDPRHLRTPLGPRPVPEPRLRQVRADGRARADGTRGTLSPGHRTPGAGHGQCPPEQGRGTAHGRGAARRTRRGPCHVPCACRPRTRGVDPAAGVPCVPAVGDRRRDVPLLASRSHRRNRLLPHLRTRTAPLHSRHRAVSPSIDRPFHRPARPDPPWRGLSSSLSHGNVTRHGRRDSEDFPFVGCGSRLRLGRSGAGSTPRDSSSSRPGGVRRLSAHPGGGPPSGPLRGHPGRGVATVVRLGAGLLHVLWCLLPGVQLVGVTRAALRAGHTERRTEGVFRKCCHAVLFMDEAYSHAPGEAASGHCGKAVRILLGPRGDRRDEVVVVTGCVRVTRCFLDSGPVTLHASPARCGSGSTPRTYLSAPWPRTRRAAATSARTVRFRP